MVALVRSTSSKASALSISGPGHCHRELILTVLGLQCASQDIKTRFGFAHTAEDSWYPGYPKLPAHPVLTPSLTVSYFPEYLHSA